MKQSLCVRARVYVYVYACAHVRVCMFFLCYCIVLNCIVENYVFFSNRVDAFEGGDKLFIKLLLINSLLFIAVIAENLKTLPILRSALSNNIINYDLPDDVISIHYNIKLIPFINTVIYLFEGRRNKKIPCFI